jgi:hypothetical protein
LVKSSERIKKDLSAESKSKTAKASSESSESSESSTVTVSAETTETALTAEAAAEELWVGFGVDGHGDDDHQDHKQTESLVHHCF